MAEYQRVPYLWEYLGQGVSLSLAETKKVAETEKNSHVDGKTLGGWKNSALPGRAVASAVARENEMEFSESTTFHFIHTSPRSFHSVSYLSFLISFVISLTVSLVIHPESCLSFF